MPITNTMKSSPIASRPALRRTFAALIAAVTVAACATPAHDSASLDAAIAGPQRSDSAKARDVYRHPGETLRFFGIAPASRVLEIDPGNGWYTEILAPYLHDKGQLYETPYAGPSP
jgi:predicted methyltransferase